MAVQSLQYSSFLGGEVSPRLQYRTDMDKFGKWFKTAENIRFHTIGSFENRPGFVKIAETKNNNAGEPIKLVAFSFNDEQSFMVGFGQDYFRVYKDSKPIVDEEGTPKYWYSPIRFNSEVEFKYAQSGDIVFLTVKGNPVYELRRLEKDGSEWEIRLADIKIPPFDEENSDDDFTLAGEEKDWGDNAPIFFEIEDNLNTGKVKNFTVYIGNEEAQTKQTQIFFEEDELTFNELVTLLNESEVYSTYKFEASISGKTLQFTPINPVSYKYMRITYDIKESITKKGFSIDVNGIERIKSLTIGALDGKYFTTTEHFRDSITVTPQSVGISEENIDEFCAYVANDAKYVFEKQINKIFLASGNKYTFRYYLRFSNKTLYTDAQQINTYARNQGTTTETYYNSFGGELTLNAVRTGVKNSVQNIMDSQTKKHFTITSSKDFFDNKELGETFCVRTTVNSNLYRYNAGSNYTEVTSPEYKGSGSWRLLVLGNWVGEIHLEYSKDEGDSWVRFYSCSSTDKEMASNPNTSGQIESEDLVMFRVISKQDSHGTLPMQIEFETKSMEVNCVYKINKIINNRTAWCENIKNNIGAFEATPYWREAAFSKTKGYPTCIGFYQNRMLLGKDYIIYGSKTNDFWNFYESIELKDDDPITLSLLSYRVNNIKNIISVRNLFAFTQGGEFGISSEGALTQSDKFLKQFSNHGSYDSLPIVVGSVVIFVDKSTKKVRALQYSFEADNFEAEDVSVLIEELLENEEIITTEYIPNKHEVLFLSATGTIWVFKFYPEQNIYAWTHWKHGYGKITNICVVPNGPEDDLYIALDAANGKYIEKMTLNNYLDSAEIFEGEELTQIKTTLAPYSACTIIETYNNGSDVHTYRYKVKIPEDGIIELKNKCSKVQVGYPYTSTATLLSPEITQQDSSNTVYYRKRPFKVHFVYKNSYGFKIGVEEEEKMSINFQDIYSDIDAELDLTSGKKDVLIPSRYNGSARVSFVQDEPYPMAIENVSIEVDYGGK